MLSKKVEFRAAVPVWPEKYIDEMNISVVLTAEFAVAGKRLLRIAASSCYQIFADGGLFEMGPARAGHGFFRVDELPLPENCKRIEIIVAGYNNNSFQFIDEPPFVCAEVEREGRIELFTDTVYERCGFKVRTYSERIQKCQRYSFQRNFAEAYDLTGRPAEESPALVRAVNGELNFIERGIEIYKNEREDAKEVVAEGKCGHDENAPLPMDRAIISVGPQLKGFRPEELEICTAWEACKITYNSVNNENRAIAHGDVLDVPADGFVTLGMERNLCGVIALDVETDEGCEVYAMVDELCGEDGAVNFFRLGASALVYWKLPAGRHSLMSFEPHLFKYIKIAVLGGGARVSNVHIRRVGFYMPGIAVKTDNPKVRAVIDAAVETFRQNTYDIFTDCASRERAGWLCDSFFTSRAEYVLTGESRVERNFIENFLLPKSFKCLPEGMLPMCYPADHYDGTFIPNWAMWFVLELEEYYRRTGDAEMIERARKPVMDLIGYFRKFENDDGLLENLESWIFVEWSHANDLVQNVNFPTNMFYAKMKRVAGALYGEESLIGEADALAAKIREQSFDGKFFCDNLVRDGEKLRPSGECTETCQYYAFFTGVATPETFPDLWNTLLHEFGPARKEHNPYPQIAFSNVLVGQMMRLDLLIRYGFNKEIIDNIEDYFYYMAEKTGTLWELDTVQASCSHGFTSIVLVWLNMLGMIERK